MIKYKLIISIHDFSPKYISELEEILTELDTKSYDKRTILAIPNFRYSFPLKGNKKAIELLYNEYKKGNEICLHGYSHQKIDGEAEFKDIRYAEASYKIRLAKFELKKIGIYTRGFIPPYWKISQEGEEVVRNEGFTFIAKNPEIKDLRNNNIYISKPIWFWPYNKLVDYAFRYFNEFLARSWLKSNEIVRVEIHPHDLWKSKPFDCALKLLEYLSKERELISYEEFLNSG